MRRKTLDNSDPLPWETSSLCSRFSRQPRGLRLRGGAKDVNRDCTGVDGQVI